MDWMRLLDEGGQQGWSAATPAASVRSSCTAASMRVRDSGSRVPRGVEDLLQLVVDRLHGGGEVQLRLVERLHQLLRGAGHGAVVERRHRTHAVTRTTGGEEEAEASVRSSCSLLSAGGSREEGRGEGRWEGGLMEGSSGRSEREGDELDAASSQRSLLSSRDELSALIVHWRLGWPSAASTC